MSLKSYQQVRTLAESPRSTEQRLIHEVTRGMAAAWDSGARGGALMVPLHRNREMWSTFASVCGAPGNALPAELRAGIISLALWIDRHTSAVVAGREPIDALLEVNRALMDGLAPARIAA